MNCATHNDIAAVAFCRTCGKPLCGNCTRDVRGVIYCEACLAARMEGTAPPVPGFVPPQTPPQSGYQQFKDQGLGMKVAPGSSSGPHPAVAGILGAIPFGIGAVYNGQYAKGLAHLFIFVMLIYGANNGGNWDWLFGIGIAFFVVYQIIDAVRTAKAIQMGQPAPDPLGLAQTFGAGERFDASKVPVGAVVLIGLGVLFLLHTMGVWQFGLDRFWPLTIVFVGAWMFYRQWDRSSQTCPCGRCRTRWLMGPTMVLTTGVLLLLSTTTPIGLDRTWPAWILAVGVVKLLQSTASSEGHIGPLPPAGPPPSAPAPPQAPQNSGAPSSGEVDHV
jgi:hypothetical protein